MSTRNDERRATVAPRRITEGATIHHHFYFTNSSWSSDSRTLYFVGYDGPNPNLFRADLSTGGPPRIERLTDRVDINPFSAAADDQDEYIYFTGGRSIFALSLKTGETEEIAHFPQGLPSNCAVSSDGRWVATSVRGKGRFQLVAVDRRTGAINTVVEADRAIGHVQFSRAEPYRILYSGPPEKRIWLVNLDGTGDRLLYDQDPAAWIVHESWLGSDKVIFTHWPYALMGVDIGTGQVWEVARTNAWHACADRSGSFVVFDTVHPDRGLQLLDVERGTWSTLCEPRSSNLGHQWRGTTPAPNAPADPSIFRDVLPGSPPPALDMSESTYGPQWTHPHPAFSPDGRYVVYTSDVEGFPHVYVVEVPSP